MRAITTVTIIQITILPTITIELILQHPPTLPVAVAVTLLRLPEAVHQVEGVVLFQGQLEAEEIKYWGRFNLF